MSNKKHKILIVDDFVESIDIMVNLLKDKHILIVAKSGEDALRRLEEVDEIDLILLDIVMPGMNGYEVCKILKANEDTQKIPVIFLTAKTEEEDLLEAFRLGAVDFLRKPFKPSELKARINTQLFIKEQQQEIEKKNNELESLIHVMCHDLANHFIVIDMARNLMERRPERTSKILPDIALATKNGIDVVNLIREMQDVKHKAIKLTTINLKKSLNVAIKLLGNKLIDKNIEVINKVNPAVNVKAEKRSLINSVFLNLLTNAVKFSFPDSRIEIETIIEDRCLLIIRDYGIGIPDTIINNLFKISKKTHRDGTKGETGTGFGMPLVKKFLTAYGANIEVKSTDYEVDPTNSKTEIIISFVKV